MIYQTVPFPVTSNYYKWLHLVNFAPPCCLLKWVKLETSIY